MDDLSVVIPVHKEDPEIVTRLYETITSYGAECIVVDDGSTMTSLEIPCAHYYPHRGYGSAIKFGIGRASRPLVLTMDGDGQHDPEDVKKLYAVFKMISDCSMVVGCRWNLNENAFRWLGRKILNFLASVIAGHYLIDLNSGMRIFKKNLAVAYSPILCDTFSFTTSLTMSMVADKKKVAWLPIDVRLRASGRSHVKLFRHGLVTLYYIFWVGLAMRTRKFRENFRNW